MIGQTVSHYEILEKLGSGGMGDVYKARDVRLKRMVALKFLPATTCRDDREKRRFFHEAQAASALEHENICTVHEIGETDSGLLFIAMGFYEGETLRQKLAHGPLPITEALDIALKISAGLARVHEKNIVHRDIKPGNIMLTEHGGLRIMDFGLAKVGDSSITQTGSTVGTISYMSPEQIEGKSVDGRADIFSFGVVLYELLIGRLPFTGETAAAVIHAILNLPPKPIESSELAPDLIELIMRMLEKDVEKRCQSMQEVHDELLRLRQGKENSTGYKPKRASVSPIKRNRSMKRMVGIAALMCSLAIITFFIFKPLLSKPLPEMKIVPIACSPGMERSPAFSPDGNQIAYVWDGGNQKDYDVYVKMIGAGTPLKLTRKSAIRGSPGWSPDGRMVTFLQLSGRESGIYKVPALGGVEQRLLAIDSANVRAGLDWSPDGGSIVYSDRNSANVPNGIFLFSLSTMEKRQITFPPAGTAGDDEPTFSPNGRWIAFRRQLSYASYAIFIIPFSGGSEKRITLNTQEIVDLAWSEDGGKIIFSSDFGGTFSLWRTPFKGGEPKPITAGVEDVSRIDISRKGQRLAYTKGSVRDDNIWKGDISQKEGQIVATKRLIATSQSNWSGRFSPNGQKIIFPCMGSGKMEIWLCDSDGSNPIQLTDFGGQHNGAPSWSPDNQHIAFDSRPYGNGDIFIMNAEGGQLRRMTTEASDESIATWSRDGRWIYFMSNRSGKNTIWKCPADRGKAVQVLDKKAWISYESQDGKWLYYHTNSAIGEIWKLSLENGEQQLILKDISLFNWVLAEDGIYHIHASSDGNENHLLFYSFASNNTKKLVTLKQKNIWSFDISPDRGSFLVTDEQIGEYDIYLVENFQ